MPEQSELFDNATDLPNGLRYQAEFIAENEEAALLVFFRDLPLEPARYKSYTAHRRVVAFGAADFLEADYRGAAARPVHPFPEALLRLRARIAAVAGCPEVDFVHALVSEYRTGTPLGWHRDAPQFEVVAGISLASACRMRFRPLDGPTHAGREFLLQPRSLYILQQQIRWAWQHSIPPTPALRYSITMRTLRKSHRTAGEI